MTINAAAQQIVGRERRVVFRNIIGSAMLE